MLDWIFFFVSVLIFRVYGCLFCMHLCFCTMCMQRTPKNLKRASDPLQFVLQTDVNFYAGPWNQIRDFLSFFFIFIIKKKFRLFPTSHFSPPPPTPLSSLSSPQSSQGSLPNQSFLEAQLVL